MKKFKNLDHDLILNIKKSLFCIFIIYVFSLTSIIRANFNYIDDLGRVFSGYGSWEFFSRYISSFLSTFIHAGKYLTDISPLPQIIACLFTSFASVIIIYTFSNKKSFSWWKIIAIIPLGLSPYFLECLSYKFDSPYMALSILASIWPILFVKDKNWKFALAIIAGTLIMCTTYQAASGIFPILIIFYCFKNWNDGELNFKDTIKLLIFSAFYYIIGLLIFKIFLLKNVDSYASTSLVTLRNLIPTFFTNLITYFKYIYSDFRKVWLLLILIMMILFIVVSTINSKQKKYISTIFSIITLLLGGTLMFGIYPALANPLFDPRAMFGVGIFLSLIAINIMNIEKCFYFKIPLILLSWCFIVFAFTYGNALQEQKRYTDFRIQMLISDLNSLEIMNNDNIKNIQFQGNIGRSPVINNMPKNILHRLIPDTLAGGEWIWSKYYFYNYFGLKKLNLVTNENFKNLTVLKDTMYHKIKGNDENILIILK